MDSSFIWDFQYDIVIFSAKLSCSGPIVATIMTLLVCLSLRQTCPEPIASAICSCSTKCRVHLSQTNCQHTYGHLIARLTCPEPIVGASVGEVDDQLKGFIGERLQSKQDMVDEEIPINVTSFVSEKRINIHVGDIHPFFILVDFFIY